MVDYAIKNGVNYFDTAWPYHGGMSERIMGRVLKRYPRESFYLADKFPGHQISATYDPAATFEEQLRRCGVEYFDFYLLHNVYENSIKTYLDPRWGILEYFKEQKKLGRIKHLGFSTHGSIGLIEEFLDICGEDMEFCQIQLNYLDWTLQDAKAKYDMLTRRGIPVWVMEPLKGGRLATLNDAACSILKEAAPDRSIASWGFRYLMGLPNVQTVLSGMGSLEMIRDNAATFEEYAPLDAREQATLEKARQAFIDDLGVPCSACRYCCDNCPENLDIPLLIRSYNEKSLGGATWKIPGLDQTKGAEVCIGCGACMSHCPQKINIPQIMENLKKKE
jgi:predicted aldo/keto reductase-like oxidoreductase